MLDLNALEIHILKEGQWWSKFAFKYKIKVREN